MKMTTTELERAVAIAGPGSPEAIEIKLQQARDALPGLIDAVADATFNVERDHAGAQNDAADRARLALRDGRELIEGLELALTRAIAARDGATEKQREAIAASQREAMKVHLRQRSEAGEKLTAAISEAVSAWRALVSANDAVVAAVPSGEKLAQGSGHTLDELHTAVLSEFVRVGWSPPVSRQWGMAQNPPSFPGVKPTDYHTRDNPSLATSLSSALKQSADFISRTIINGRKGEV
jgi:hypothetical protein